MYTVQTASRGSCEREYPSPLGMQYKLYSVCTAYFLSPDNLHQKKALIRHHTYFAILHNSKTQGVKRETTMSEQDNIRIDDIEVPRHERGLAPCPMAPGRQHPKEKKGDIRMFRRLYILLQYYPNTLSLNFTT
jgi:hypothetical protein